MLDLLIGLSLALPSVSFGEPRKLNLDPIEHRLVVQQVSQEFLTLGSEAEWDAFWRRFSNDSPPAIDFQRSDVLIALMGTQGSGGFSVKIVEIQKSESGSTIRVALCEPRQNDQISEITSPYDAEVVPKLPRPVRWMVLRDESACIP